MPYSNTPTRYGSVTKTFHWLTALLILSAIVLGMIATDMAHRIAAPEAQADPALIARATLLFSLHKTIGLAAFFTALLRILWALGQPHPGLLNGERRAEATLASTVHWLLYGAMLITPLSGWVHHAATAGFAPIWWPFGQGLPLVPQSEAVSQAASTVHFLSSRLLMLTIALHVAGALKHHLIDKDDTLRRMLPLRRVTAQPSPAQPGHALPLLAATAIWLAILGAGAAPALIAPPDSAAAPVSVARPLTDADTTADRWQVQDGSLALSIRQMGSAIEGRFDDWSAAIAFTDDSAQERNGTVRVEIAIASLSLGSVSQQAMGADFFDAASHPSAVFEADILRREAGFTAEGTLTIKDHAIPVSLPFTLDIEGDTATMTGTLDLDRRDFAIGAGITDEGTLGFGVTISVTLTATRAAS